MADRVTLKPGDLFEGRFQIESILGSGGFATVYRAMQVDLFREVALKVLKPLPERSRGGDDDGGEHQRREIWLERFRREARLVARLRDPHSITMYDFGTTWDGSPYMVFELIDGKDLSLVLNEEGALSAERTVRILRQCLYSLREAHHLGVLHRDIKPPNVLLYDHLGEADLVKVLDFGIAKPMDNQDADFTTDLTRDGTVLGTPRYMSPEQLQGETLTPASDLYSLGLVAYELITGTRAIQGTNAVMIIGSQLSDAPIRLPEDYRGELREIIYKLLEKRPEQRYQSAAEVLAALENIEFTDSPRPASAAPHRPHLDEPKVTAATEVILPSSEVFEGWLWDAAEVGTTVVYVENSNHGLIANYRTQKGERQSHSLTAETFAHFGQSTSAGTTREANSRHRILRRANEQGPPRELQVLINRVATLSGEQITLHLCDDRSLALKLEDLTKSPEETGILRRWCSSPRGIVIVSGKSGSGKTSTLYACMKEIKSTSPRVIFSLEENASQLMKGTHQIEVDLDDREAYARAIKQVWASAFDVLFIGSTLTMSDPSFLWSPALSAAEEGRLVFLQVDAVSAEDALSKLSQMLQRPVAEHLVGVCWQEIKEDATGRRFISFTFLDPADASSPRA